MPSVVIISRDEDFASVLSPLLARELALDCTHVPDFASAQPHFAQAALVVTDGQESGAFGGPLLELPKSGAPYAMADILACASSLLAPPSEAIELGGGYRFLARGRQIENEAGESVQLTDRETTLLAALLSAGEEGVAKDELLRSVWGFEPDINTHTLETHIYRLRTKIRDVFGIEMIDAIEGGYKLGL